MFRDQRPRNFIQSTCPTGVALQPVDSLEFQQTVLERLKSKTCCNLLVLKLRSYFVHQVFYLLFGSLVVV